MAISIDLDGHENTGAPEEQFEAAAAAWRVAREKLDAVDPAALPPLMREAYFRVLARIGLWADARVMAANDDDENDAEGEDAT